MTQLLPFTSINGEIVPVEQASIPTINNGVLLGQGVFTTLKVKQRVPLFFDKHKKRLLSNMQQLQFDKKALDFPFEKAATALIEKNNTANCLLRITILNYQKTPIIIIHASPLPQFEEGINVITVEDTRDSLKNLKTINRLVNNLAIQEAKDHGADDALFVSDGKIIESTNSTVFTLNDKNQIITPPLNGKGLEGVTKQVINEQIPIFEEIILEDTKGPLVLVSSLRIRKVLSLNNKKLQTPEVLSHKLLRAVEKAEKEYLNKSHV